MWVVFYKNEPGRSFFNDEAEARKELEFLEDENVGILTVDDYIHTVLGTLTQDELSYDMQNKNYYAIKHQLGRLESIREDIADIIAHVKKFLSELEKHRGD